MNAFDSGSDLDGDSQATQLLETILDPDRDLTSKHNDSHAPGRGDTSISKDITASDTSPSRNSSLTYHFHGLATTQTQTQNYAEDEANEGSQKENIHANKSTELRSRLTPTHAEPFSPDTTSPRHIPTKTPHIDQLTRVPSRAAKSRSFKNKAVSFQSPRSKVSAGVHDKLHPPPIRSTSYPPSNRPEILEDSYSQDSFADSLSEDPERQFLAVSKQFEIPLSELGRISESVNKATREHSASKTMFRYPSSERSTRSSPSSEGVVLVAATPSNSGGSQSQSSHGHSQLFEGSQGPPYGRQPDYTAAIVDGYRATSQQSTQDSIPSSSYLRSTYGERDEIPEGLDMQATQPSTQVDSYFTSQDREEELRVDEPQNSGARNVIDRASGVHNDPSVSTLPQSRNLLSLVNPKNQWRYAKYGNVQAGLPHRRTPAPNSTSHTDNIVSLGEPTQPSFEDEGGEPPSRQFPRRTWGNGHRGGMQRGHDDMDVVPDSEPLQSEYDTPRRAKALAQSPGKRNFLRISPSSDPEPNSGEIIPDSMEVDDGEEMDLSNKQHDDGDNHDHSMVKVNDDDDDDDDIPLAKVISKSEGRGMGKPTNKGKSKTSTMLTPRPKKAKQTGKGHGNDEVPPVPPNEGKTKESYRPQADATTLMDNNVRPMRSIPTERAPGTGRSWETGEVPSSVPDQDLATTSNGRNLRSKSTPLVKTNRDTRSSANPRLNVKRSSTKSIGRSRQPARSEHNIEHEDELFMSRTDEEDDDDRTEPAEDEYTEVDPHTTGSSSRKRKRSSRASHMTTRASSKTPAIAPVTRQTKKRRSVASARGGWEPTRVFALWRQDGHFYSGVAHSHKGGSQYLIKFDDGTESTLNIDQMRLCELHIGDDVLFSHNTRSSKVVNVTQFESTSVVQVSLDDSVEDLQIRDLRVATKTITYAWKDRVLTPDSISTVIKPALAKPSPTPSRLSIASGPSARGTKHRAILAKTGLVVTLSAGNENWSKDKNEVMAAIKDSGGTVIEDWGNIIRMEGRHSQSGNRWVIEKSEVKWAGKEDIERVFLLADDANQKAKFLIALALGIPCLSVAWLRESVESGQEKDWLSYTLPQGYSDALGARPSQQVDMDWGNSVHQLNAIMDNAVPCKLFRNMSILCVGSEMMPQPKGKTLPGTDEKLQEAHNAVSRIILSMGAERVEAVSSLGYASAPPVDFDLVVFKDPQPYHPELDKTRTVHWSWVKDCLIASRQLPIPSWVELENSQDT